MSISGTVKCSPPCGGLFHGGNIRSACVKVGQAVKKRLIVNMHTVSLRIVLIPLSYFSQEPSFVEYPRHRYCWNPLGKTLYKDSFPRCKHALDGCYRSSSRLLKADDKNVSAEIRDEAPVVAPCRFTLLSFCKSNLVNPSINYSAMGGRLLGLAIADRLRRGGRLLKESINSAHLLRHHLASN